MKKRPLCIVFLIIYILLASTVLAIKIEDTMMLRVATVKPSPQNGNRVSISSLVVDDFGRWHLYFTEEGTGWETGIRVHEADKYLYTVFLEPEPYVEASFWGENRVILAASRTPQENERIVNVERPEHISDRFLITFVEPAPYEMMDENGEIVIEQRPIEVPEGFWDNIDGLVAQSDTAGIVEIDDTTVPFMEQAAKGRFVSFPQIGWRVFSLSEVESFCEKMPYIVLALVLYLIPVVLLVWLCFFRNSDTKSLLLRVNLGISALAFAGAIYLTVKINIPLSMLPVNNIFTLDHYRSELATVSKALTELGSSGTLEIIERACRSARLWTAIGCGLAVIAALAELFIIKKEESL